MYESDIRGRYIINSRNCHEVADSVVVDKFAMGKGYIARDYKTYPLGSFAAPFPMETIPRSEWRDRIQEKDRLKAWPKDHKILAGFKSKNQNGTNYCWGNAPVQAVEYCVSMQGTGWAELSPASVCAPVKNFRNVGGWGSQALEYIVKNGVSPVQYWPANAIDRRYDNEESQRVRQNFRVTEWWELKERNFNQLMTCLLLGYPVAIGLSWWSHEVLACAAAVRGKDDFLIDIDNSWGAGWKDNGHGFLTQSKATPDDAVVPRVIVPYDGGFPVAKKSSGKRKRKLVA